ncbi:MULTISPECIES: nuclear transport factor 2 family protein [Amycolatopsis]|nr:MULTISPECIES: nuclear transport factor 2 family protein [Amycolatopsis]
MVPGPGESKAGFERGAGILHFLGGRAADVRGERAVAQTKMTIDQRAIVDGVEVDVVCTGRFYDFCARREGDWKIARRQPICEQDRLDPELLGRFPAGYRHLGCLEGAGWLAGSATAGGLR